MQRLWHFLSDTRTLVIIGFAAFVVYATWAAFNHPIVAGTDHRIYFADPYLSPLYSPLIFAAHGAPPTSRFTLASSSKPAAK